MVCSYLPNGNFKSERTLQCCSFSWWTTTLWPEPQPSSVTTTQRWCIKWKIYFLKWKMRYQRADMTSESLRFSDALMRAAWCWHWWIYRQISAGQLWNVTFSWVCGMPHLSLSLWCLIWKMWKCQTVKDLAMTKSCHFRIFTLGFSH